MSEETQQAESSAATPVMEVDRGPLVNLTSDQRAEFRRTGELPEAPKPKEEAAYSTPEEKPASEAQPEAEAEPAGEPEAPKNTQEKQRQPKPKPTAEERIAQLEETIEKIRKGAGLKKTQAESSPATVQPPKPIQTYKDWEQAFKPDLWLQDYMSKNPESSYEGANAAMFSYMLDAREQFRSHEQAMQAQAKEIQAKADEARSRYENFDEVIQPTLAAILENQNIPFAVKIMLNDSEVLPDLLYTLGSNQEELDKFSKMAPSKQARYIALTESLIREELDGKQKPIEEKPPAKPQTQAPKPPSEVGGRAATPGDELVEAAKAGDFRAFKAEATRRQLARLKG